MNFFILIAYEKAQRGWFLQQRKLTLGPNVSHAVRLLPDGINSPDFALIVPVVMDGDVLN